MVCCTIGVVPVSSTVFPRANGVHPRCEPLCIAIAPVRGCLKINKASSAPVARGGEEDEEEQGTVNTWAVEEVGCQEEEGEVEWGERERKREE